jgi:photosystem II stability/assembly factor-like uncharacterized protein
MCYSQYNWINPKPQGNTLNSVCFVNDNIGYSVGNFGTVLKTIDGGLNWTILNSNTTKKLNGVYFINDSYGFAVGDSGIIIKTTDSGANWTTSISGVFDNLYSVFFTDSLTGSTCGKNGIILKTTDGGIQWNIIVSNVNGYLFSIDFPSNSIGYIVGGDQNQNDGLVLKSIDGGDSWILLTDSLNQCFYTTDFIDTLIGFATGISGYAVKTIDGGNNWTSMNLVQSNHTYSIKFINPQIGLASQVSGRYSKTEDGGQTWSSFNLNTSSSLCSICIKNDSSICIVGSGGATFVSNDYGTTFINTQNGPNKNLCSIDKVDNNHIFVVGDNTLIKTSDNGVNWQTSIVPELNYCIAAQFVNSTIGYAITEYGHKVKKTVDSGLTWITSSLPQTYNDITMVNESLGFMVGGGQNPLGTITWGVLCKTNDGINWIDQSGPWPYLNKVYFKNNSVGFLLGGWTTGKLYYTTNAGNNWSLLPLNISSPFVDMVFVNDNTGFLLAGSSFQANIVLKTNDGGFNWVTIYANTNNSWYNKFSSFNFIDSMNGYAVSVFGQILHTNDGGVSWVLQKSFTDNSLKSILLVNDSSGYIIGNNGNFVSFGNALNTNVPENSNEKYSSIKTYPNPFFETIKFELYSNIEDNVLIELFDINGKLVDITNKKIIQGNQLVEYNPDVNLKTGLYNYRIKGQKIFNSGKIIIDRTK